MSMGDKAVGWNEMDDFVNIDSGDTENRFTALWEINLKVIFWDNVFKDETRRECVWIDSDLLSHFGFLVICKSSIAN